MRFFDRRAHFFLGVLMVLACGTAAPPPPAAPSGAVSVSLQSDAAATAKIATAIRSVVQRMRQDGITAASRQAESYTTSLVRVDPTGSIQVVILVTAVDHQVESILEQHQARLEITDAGLRLIQAWVPFDRLEHIAGLSFVRHIRPPSYAVRR